MSDTAPVTLLATGFNLMVVATGASPFATVMHGQMTAALNIPVWKEKSYGREKRLKGEEPRKRKQTLAWGVR